MSNTTVLILCVAVPLMLGGFINFYAHRQWILYFPLFGLVLLIGYLGHLGIRSLIKVEPTDRFSVIPESMLIGNPARDMKSLFWMVSNNSYASPISLSCYIRFTNLTSKRMMIDSYSFEAKVAGRWKKLVKMDARFGAVFNIANDDFANAIEIDISSDAFDRLAQDKNIAPDEPFHGWVFLELADNFEKIEQWRFRMKSVDGIETTYLMPLKSEPNKDSLRSGGMSVMGRKTDIGSFPRVVYSERR